MDPSIGVWVVDFNPNVPPGLPAVLGERARQDPAGTIWFKTGPLDTDWTLSPGGPAGTVTGVSATLPVTSTGGATPNIALNYDNASLTLAAATTLQRAALSGDISAPAGSNTTTLATVNASPGTYPYATVVVNGKGLSTTVTSGATPAPASRTLTTTSPLRIDGGASADLSANRTLSIIEFAGGGTTGAVPDPTAETGTFLRDDGLWKPPPLTIHLGYGPDQFSGTLPSFLEGPPHFWLHPFTSLDNVSALIYPTGHNDMPIEWLVDRAYSAAEIDVYVRTVGLSTDGTGTPQLDAYVTLNGADSAVTVTIPDTETNSRHHGTGPLAVVDGDKVGIHIVASHMGSGSLVASFVLRLT